MQAFDGTRYTDLKSNPDQAKDKGQRGVRRTGQSGARSAPKKSSGFDLSLGPAYNKQNRKLRDDKLASTDEAIMYQRKLRQSLARQAGKSTVTTRRAQMSQTAAAGRMIISGGRVAKTAPSN